MRPAGIRFQELLENLNLIPPQVYNIGPCESPPWEIVPPIIHLECALLKKNETNRDIYLNCLNRIIDEYADSQIIYTDGSKTEEGVGSAFPPLVKVSLDKSPALWGIYTAELYAIWQALRYVEMQLNDTTLICSDSLSAIQALGDDIVETQ
ncbi:hypothetical protein JTB14_031180 [Gonioctena quinquepunctata]|nr:hypothetical protein JTB14_031180 [Gonioctena quinquepunctata]